MGDVLLERAVQVQTQTGWEPGCIRLLKPVQRENDWGCEYEIDWPGFFKRFQMFGVDGYQALELAFRIIPTEISVTEAFKQGRLRLFDEAEPLDDQSLYESFHAKPMGNEQ